VQVRRCAPDEFGVDLEALAAFVGAAGPLAVVDLETTGLPDDPAAELLEVGAVLIDPGGDALTVVSTLVRPSRPLPLPIQRLTGLVDADVAGAPEVEELAPEVAALLRGRCLVAHNAAFERRFLSRFIDASLAEATYLDSQDLLAISHPDAPDLRLESFTRMLLGREEQHRALDDAIDTLRVLSQVAVGARAQEPRYQTARTGVERPTVQAPSAAFQAAIPPSSMNTFSWPKRSSIHHRRAPYSPCAAS